MSGAGRPEGRQQSTLDRGREFAALLDYGHTARQIADREGVAISCVYDYAKPFRRIHLVAEQAQSMPDAPSEDAPQMAPPRPRKMSFGVVARRAAMAKRTDPVIFMMPSQRREFLFDAILDANQYSDDGIHLEFGYGKWFRSREFYLKFHGVTADDLQEIFAAGFLEDVDGESIRVADRHGLVPKPKIGRSANGPNGFANRPVADHIRMTEPPRQTSRGPVPGQMPLPPMGMPGAQGRQSDSEEIRIFPESNAAPAIIFPESKSAETGIFPDSRATAATAEDELNQSLSSSSSSSDRAHDSGEITLDDSGKITPDDSGKITPVAPPPPDLAAELGALAGLGRAVSTGDRATVRGWEAAGVSRETMEAVIRDKLAAGRANEPGWKPNAMRYFDKAVRERAGQRGSDARSATPTPAESASTLSPEDRALRERLLKVAQMRARHSAAPLAPRFARFLEVREIGIIWLDDMERWQNGGFRGETPAEFEKYVAAYQQPPPSG